MWLVNLFRIATGLIGVTLLFWVGVYLTRDYDMRPATPTHQVRCCLFVHFTLRPPAGLAPAYVLGMSDPNSPAARDLRTCRGNTAALSGALDRQNAAVRSLKASADAWQLRGRQAVDEAMRAGAARRALAQRILADRPPANADALALCSAAEAELRRTGP